jgi:hypothetical protein
VERIVAGETVEEVIPPHPYDRGEQWGPGRWGVATACLFMLGREVKLLRERLEQYEEAQRGESRH